MQNLTGRVLTIGDVFGLDRCDLNRVERATSSPLEESRHPLYLFTCEDLLPEGQRIAIDDCDGMIGVYYEGTLLKKTSLNMMEIYVLTSLVLSFPYAVSEQQIRNLYQLYRLGEKDLGILPITDNAHIMPPVQELVVACNEKIRSLCIVILSVDTTYQLAAIGE